GWAATGALLAIALWRGLAPASPPVTGGADPAAGMAIEQVRGRWLDNAPLGRLYVVSGRVHNVANTPASLPRLVLELRDAAGRAIGAPIPLRGTATPERLREADAAALAAIGSDFPGGLAAGGTRDFGVVAWPLPRDAMRFASPAGSEGASGGGRSATGGAPAPLRRARRLAVADLVALRRHVELVLARQPFLEVADRLSDARAQLGQPPRAEQHQDDREDDHQLARAHSEH